MGASFSQGERLPRTKSLVSQHVRPRSLLGPTPVMISSGQAIIPEIAAPGREINYRKKKKISLVTVPHTAWIAPEDRAGQCLKAVKHTYVHTHFRAAHTEWDPKSFVS